MANFEQLQLALQTHQNIQGLRRDMRRNAEGYKQALLTGKSAAEVKAILLADAVQYIRRLDWQKAIVDTPARLANLSSGLVALGSSTTEAGNLYTELRSAANTLDAATVNTTAQINAAADALLAAVAPHDSVW